MVTLDKPKIAYRVDNAGNDAWTIVEVTDGAAPETITGLVFNTRYEVRVLDWGPSAYATTPFSPAALFANGEQGVWYDPSDLGTMWEERTDLSYGSDIPASKDAPVCYIADKSGNGNHATQSVSTARPILRQTAGGLWYLEFDGVSNALRTANNFPLTGNPAFSVYAALRSLDSSDDCALAWGGKTNLAASGLYVGASGFTSGSVYAYAFHNYKIAAHGTDDRVYSYVKSSGPINTTSSARVNGVTEDAGGHSSGTPNIGNGPFRLGEWVGNGGELHGRVYGCVVIDRAAEASETGDTEQYLAAKSGVTLS